MSLFEATPFEHMMRKLNSCAHTLYVVADMFDDMDDPENADDRADLVVLVENLLDVASYVTERARDVAWLHTPVPERDGEVES